MMKPQTKAHYKDHLMFAALLVILFLLLFGKTSVAQNPVPQDLEKHKMVVQFTESDSLGQAGIIEMLVNIKREWPNADIEVVCQGPGIALMVKTKTKVPTLVEEWQKKGVTFAVCNNSMRKRKVKAADLLNQAVVVPSAAVELVKKQEAGWAYLQ